MKTKIHYFLIIILFALNACGGGETTRADNSNLGKYPDITLLSKKAKSDSVAANKLIKILTSDPKSQRRAEAASLIGKIKLKKANNSLLKAMNNDDDVVRLQTILAIGKLQIADNYEIVYKTWKNTNEKYEIRLNALRALGYFKNMGAIYTLINIIKKNKDSNLSNIALQTIHNTKSSAAAKLLFKILKKSSYSYAYLVAGAIAKLKQQNTFKDITKYINEKLNNTSVNGSVKLLLTMLCDVKYRPAVKVFIKAYLLLSNNNDLNKKIKKTLKAFKLKKSYVVVSEGAMNLRSRPNIRSRVRGILEIGQLGVVIQASNVKHTISGIENYWYKVKTSKGKIGWLFGGYIKIFNPKKL